jgi:acyl-CoA hydrolase
MVVLAAPADVREKAKELCKQYVEAQETAEIINRYRDIVNFSFWRATCEAEVTEPLLRAREATYRAGQEFENARLQTAKKAFEQAFVAWREVLDASPVLRDDSLTAEDLAETVAKYRKVLEQLDEKFPKPFLLQDVLDRAGPLE